MCTVDVCIVNFNVDNWLNITFCHLKFLLTFHDFCSFSFDIYRTIIAPVMETLGAYSNYWCGMTEQV